MSATLSTIPVNPKIRLKGIALPIEHGSWGFLFEPLLAGLLIAPTLASMWISLLVIGAFLTRQPLKIFITDWLANRNLPQTEFAFKWTILYGTIFTFGLLGSLSFVKFDSFLPFFAVIPLAIYQIYCDVSKQSRQLLPELTGAVAISSSVAVIALANDLKPAIAFALWAIFIARLIPSILYVRNRLRLEKGKRFSKVSPISSHLIALIFIGILAFFGLSSVLTVPIFVILCGRTIWGLSAYRKRVKAMKIGIWEVIYGTLVALSVVIGYYTKI